MKTVIVFQDRFKYKSLETFEICVLNEQGDFFESITVPNTGFRRTVVEADIHGFDFFNTIEQASMFIKERLCDTVDIQSADFLCPVCNRGYTAKDRSDDRNVWSYIKECACGHKINVEGRKTVNYTVL